MGDIIVLAILAIVIGLVIRSMWKSHKNGNTCGYSGGCQNCPKSCSSRVEK